MGEAATSQIQRAPIRGGSKEESQCGHPSETACQAEVLLGREKTQSELGPARSPNRRGSKDSLAIRPADKTPPAPQPSLRSRVRIIPLNKQTQAAATGRTIQPSSAYPEWMRRPKKSQTAIGSARDCDSAVSCGTGFAGQDLARISRAAAASA